MRNILIILFLFIINQGYSQNIHHWESLVVASNEWRYFSGNSEPPSAWAELTFNDDAWLKGPGGIGWGDGDDATVISRVPSVYLRRKFSVAELDKIVSLILYVDFDDGFVAYLNGKEIARANIGTPGVRPSFNQYATNCDSEAQIPTGGTPARFMLNTTHLGYLRQGENVLALQVHDCNATSSDLSSTTFLIAGISVPGSFYQALPAWFRAPETGGSHLPLVVIETGGRPIQNEPKIDARMKIIHNGPGKPNSPGDAATDYDGLVGIEIRGQSSQMFPKKSYGFETRTDKGEENKVSLLGLPEHDDWVLYAPYSDKTMLRNDITFYLGGKLGRWQPRARFVEVYLNGDYIGVYQLVERIKRGKERVDIAKMDNTDISGDKLTGGYIFKVDKIQDLTPNDYFVSNPTNRYQNARNYAFSYYYPKSDAIVTNQREYLKSFILQFENNLNASWFKDPPTHYSKYIDVDSFVDFQIMNELANNVDGYRYSTFFYKQRDSQGGKMVSGPLWDFDLGYGNLNYSWRHQSTNQWCYSNYGPGEPNCMHWWARLMEDPAYVQKVKTRWSNLRKSVLHTDSVMAYMDRQVYYLGAAVDRNFKRWPILGVYVWPNNFVGKTHEEEVTNLKTWIRQRLTWMDSQWLITTGIDTIEQAVDIVVYPNPATDRIFIQWPDFTIADQRIEIIDVRGVCLISKFVDGSGRNHAEIDISHIPKGIYFVRLTGSSGSTSAKILKQ